MYLQLLHFPISRHDGVEYEIRLPLATHSILLGTVRRNGNRMDIYDCRDAYKLADGGARLGCSVELPRVNGGRLAQADEQKLVDAAVLYFAEPWQLGLVH